MSSYLLADHHGRGHVLGGAANNAQLIKSEDEEEAHQTGDGPLSAAAARQQHTARRAENRLSPGAPRTVYYLIVSAMQIRSLSIPFLNPFSQGTGFSQISKVSKVAISIGGEIKNFVLRRIISGKVRIIVPRSQRVNL